MQIEILQAKLQKAIVTASSVSYRGSITIDEDIMDELGVVANQSCDVNSIDGFRGRTYVIPGPRGSGCVEANGALSSHILKGDVIHINFFCTVHVDDARCYEPKIVASNKK